MIDMLREINTLLNQYVLNLKDIYGDSLRSVILFGSYARGDYNGDSDIDIMILLDISETEVKRYGDSLSDMTYDFNMEHDLDIEPLVHTVALFQKWEKNYPFFSNIKKEGVTLYAA